MPTFREYTAADGGYAYLDAAFEADQGQFRVGPGTLTMEGDTTGKEIFGATSARAGALLTGLAYKDAKVGFVRVG